MADWILKQGDTAVTLTDTLTYSTGSAAVLTGGSVKFVMRARSANAPAVNRTATIVSGAAGTVSYTPDANDTATAGLFAAYWLVTFSGGTIQRFPTDGYLSVEIQENLETTNQTIVELDDVKDYLNLAATDRSHDGELLRFVAGVTPVIEHYVGPVLPIVVQNETHDGGHQWVTCRRRPVLTVHQVVEYRGPIAYTLAQVPTPDLGTIYSYMVSADRIVRRTVGGGITPFPAGADQVWVTYTAGRASIPQNIRLAALELVRVNYQQTQQSGRGPIGAGGSVDDAVGSDPVMGYLVPNRVRELLQPSRKHPATA